MQRISFSLASHDNVISNDFYRFSLVKEGDSQTYNCLYPGFRISDLQSSKCIQILYSRLSVIQKYATYLI